MAMPEEKVRYKQYCEEWLYSEGKKRVTSGMSKLQAAKEISRLMEGVLSTERIRKLLVEFDQSGQTTDEHCETSEKSYGPRWPLCKACEKNKAKEGSKGKPRLDGLCNVCLRRKKFLEQHDDVVNIEADLFWHGTATAIEKIAKRIAKHTRETVSPTTRAEVSDAINLFLFLMEDFHKSNPGGVT